jgi:DNA polymerase-4
MNRVIFHLDMDAFYASIEQRDNPALRGRPVVVGAPPTQRGVVAAASYEARKFGIRSAMPSVTAHRLCPRAVFVRPRMEAYKEESRAIMRLVAQTGAAIEQVSIDEAYLDLSANCQRAGADDSLLAALPVARELRRQIAAQRRLTASIGIASNKMLAKLASDFQKPNGLTLIPDRDRVEFLRSMPVRVIHGVGRVTEEVLQKAGLRTVGDIQDHPGDLRALVGSFGPTLKRVLEFGDDPKSISSENTFLKDTADRRVLRDCLREQAEDVARSLARKRLDAQTVQVKVRYGDFTTLTRQLSVEDPISDAAEIYRLAAHLLGREKLVNRPLRLLGVGVSGLVPAMARQLTLPL